MTQNPQVSSTPAQAPVVRWDRMLKVWTLLAASMTVATLACWAAMPRAGPEDGGAASADAPSSVDQLIRPEETAPARAWRFIVLHHSGTPSATLQAIEQFHLDRGFEEVGYHFLINNGAATGTVDGRITATARWMRQMAGAHTKVTDHPEFNGEGIGICLIGNFEQQPPTPAQMASLEILVLALRQRYGIPLERVLGHGDVRNTKCPGRLFPMKDFLNDLRLDDLRRHLAAPAGGP